MRNKRQLKYAAGLALAVPFLVFTVVLAEHGGEEEEHEEHAGSENSSTTELGETTETKTTETSGEPKKLRPVPEYKNLDYAEKMRKLEEQRRIEKAALKARWEAAAADREKMKDTEVPGGRREAMAKKTRGMRVQALAQLMRTQLARAENALARMDKIIQRIESRVEKMEAAGIEVAGIEDLIAQAKDQKDTVQAAVRQAKADMESLGDNDQAKDSVQSFMASMKVLKTSMIDLHKTLISIVRAMHAAMPERAETDKPADTVPAN